MLTVDISLCNTTLHEQHENERRIHQNSFPNQAQCEIKNNDDDKSITSMTWTIGSNKWCMVSVQVIVLIACSITFGTTCHQWKSSNQCPKSMELLGPFSGYDDNGTLSQCSWPSINSYFRLFAPFIGIFCSIYTIVKVCSVENDNNHHQNEEFYHIYNTFTCRVIRKMIGFAAYFHLVSLGMDLRSYFIGYFFCTDDFELNGISQMQLIPYCNDQRFLIVLYIGVIVPILLRLSHDAMYQKEKYHKFSKHINAESHNSGYQLMAV